MLKENSDLRFQVASKELSKAIDLRTPVMGNVVVGAVPEGFECLLSYRIFLWFPITHGSEVDADLRWSGDNNRRSKTGSLTGNG